MESEGLLLIRVINKSTVLFNREQKSEKFSFTSFMNDSKNFHFKFLKSTDIRDVVFPIRGVVFPRQYKHCLHSFMIRKPHRLEMNECENI